MRTLSSEIDGGPFSSFFFARLQRNELTKVFSSTLNSKNFPLTTDAFFFHKMDRGEMDEKGNKRVGHELNEDGIGNLTFLKDQSPD